jgi:hypothetical protein
MDFHAIVRMSLIALAYSLVVAIDAKTWRQLVGLVTAGYALQNMYFLPLSRSHATLWLNLTFATYFFVASVSPRGGAWYLHGAAYVGAHSLMFGYLLCLVAAGGGSLAEGFRVVDITQWGGDVPRAVEASFVLHALPVVLVNLDLWRCCGTLKEAYEGATWKGSMWSLLSGWLLPAVYQVVMEAQHGSIEVAFNTLYRIPMENINMLMHATRLMYLVVGLGCMRHVRLTLASTKVVKKTKRA